MYAIVRRKEFLVQWVRKQNSYNSSWKYNPNEVYDSCVKRLFKDRLHIAENNYITFSRRGKSERNIALELALNKARDNFSRKYGKDITTLFHVASNYPSHEPILQIIDYCLWALQRLYERFEDRYFDYVKGKYHRIIDVDDKREKIYGVYYDKRNLLTADKIKNSLLG